MEDMIKQRIHKNHIHMATAKLWSLRSTCRRLHVGAVLVKDGRTISTGYNGAPAGFPHCTPDICNEDHSCKRTIHAEMNAILFAGKYGISTEGSELFTTHAPCLECAKAMVNAGISQVFYESEYRNTDGIELLAQAGVKVDRIKVPLEVFQWLIEE